MANSVAGGSVETRIRWSVAAVRFGAGLGLAIWLGGLVFMGAVAAPLVTTLAREHRVRALGFEMVGHMVGRFLPILYGIGVLLLLVWMLEGKLAWPPTRIARWLWWLQGAGSAAMLALILTAGLMVAPRMTRLQAELLPQLERAWSQSSAAADAPAGSLLPGVDEALQQRFNAVHTDFRKMISATVLFGLLVLGLLAARTSLERASGRQLSPVPNR